MVRYLMVLPLLFWVSYAQTMRTVTFQEISGDIMNPERGWMEANYDDDPENLYAGQGVTLAWVKLHADAYRGKPLDQTFITRVENAFNYSRKNGLKVIPRVLYAESGGDAPYDIVLKHIEQLTPIFHKHADVIHVLDAGFIGRWGEWHTSSNGLCEDTKRNAILKALLGMIPQDRMLYIRYPIYKLHYITGSYTGTSPWLDSTTAFNKSDMARIGHVNDCMFYNATDRGTYPKGKLERPAALAYIGQEGPYLPYGGETCGVGGPESSCTNVLKEMAILGIDHLNRDFNKSNYSRWKSEGCYDEITKRFGYRFVLEKLTLPEAVPPGGKAEIVLTLANKGFGGLFNLRPVNVVLISADGKEIKTTTNLDPRWWIGGKTFTIKMNLEIPVTLPEGSYKIALALPDAYPSLQGDPRYSVCFANQNTWDAAKGINIIADNFAVSKKAVGAISSNQVEFKASSSDYGITPVFFRNQLKTSMHTTIQCTRNQIVIENLTFGMSALQVRIFDLSGKAVYQKQFHGAGSKSIRAELPVLENGFYIVKAVTPGETLTKNLTVVN